MTDLPKITPEQQTEIEDAWRRRLREAHGIDPGSRAATGKTALKLEHEFFVGAMTAIQALLATPGTKDRLLGPPIWYVWLMSGRSILAERDQREKEAEAEAAAAPSTCDGCGAKVEKVIGCPNGKELCQDCFDQGQG